MNTTEKYKEMGLLAVGKNKVVDKEGTTYYPRKVKKPLKAIRFFCAECMGMDRHNPRSPFPQDAIRLCTDPMCPLFDFRMGKNPFMKRELTEDQKKVARDRLASYRKS
jgi:hypothetical protein